MGYSVKDIVERIFAYADEGLDRDEKEFLLPLKTSAEASQTVREALSLKEVFA